jgi:hypothetical protein
VITTLAAERKRLCPEALQAMVEARGLWASADLGLADRDAQDRPVERSAR